MYCLKYTLRFHMLTDENRTLTNALITLSHKILPACHYEDLKKEEEGRKEEGGRESE